MKEVPNLLYNTIMMDIKISSSVFRFLARGNMVKTTKKTMIFGKRHSERSDELIFSMH